MNNGDRIDTRGPLCRIADSSVDTSWDAISGYWTFNIKINVQFLDEPRDTRYDDADDDDDSIIGIDGEIGSDIVPTDDSGGQDREPGEPSDIGTGEPVRVEEEEPKPEPPCGRTLGGGRRLG